MNRIDAFFELSDRGTTVGRELRGAVATFLTMAYILGANPAILAGAGLPTAAVVAGTAAAAGICCLLMGLFANFPIALASGMGLNAVIVSFALTPSVGSWQAAMGLVVLDGVIVTLLVLAGVRESMLKAIPVDLRRAIGAGIGLFIALIGLVNAGLVTRGEFPVPPVEAGSLKEPATALAVAGLLLTATLVVKKVPGALLIGIVAITVAARICDAVWHTEIAGPWPAAFAPPDFSIAFQADVIAVLKWQCVPLLIALLMVDFFDTLGTVEAIADQAELHDEERRIPRLKRILLVDSVSASIGGLFGVSSVTSYIESAAGVAEGARTGLHSVFVGAMFLAAILIAPLVALVPPVAVAPALIVVGFLMSSQLARIDTKCVETALPAFITLVMIPFTYSIAHGIGYGFLAYTGIQLLRGRFRDVHPLMWAASVIFIAFFLWAE